MFRTLPVNRTPDLSIVFPLSCLSLMAYEVWITWLQLQSAVGCENTNVNVHRPTNTNTKSCFSAPEAGLNEVEQRFDCV